MKKIFATPHHATLGDISLLILRIVWGTAMAIHGFGKIQAPFHWMGDGAPIPGFFQSLAALSEFGGGIAMVIGLLVPLAGFGMSCTMAVAVCMHAFVFGDPFVNPTGGRSYEMALVYLTIALLLTLMGPGRFSLDRKIFGFRK